jgi:hypothetical protein
MGYSDLSSAKAQLSLNDATEDDAADIALLVAIDAEVSRDLELKTGRKWGGTATPSVRTVDGPVGCWGTDTLLLSEPARSISSIAIVGTLAETLTAYDSGTGLGDWIPWHVTKGGDILAVRRVQNGWWPPQDGINRVTITAVWSDDASGVAAPQEIVDAATFVTVETFRQRKSSPTGEIGPDGFTIRPRNPWGFVVVTEAIKRHGAAVPVVSF